MKENHRLTKCSYPGWIKEFDSYEATLAELLSHICANCLDGADYFEGPNGKREYYADEPDQSSIQSLLGTACGCEYEYDDGT